ncbi:MAG: lipopolysaccharide assembly protein LapA domain-containing protein [Myxococcota bacterium]
MKKFILFVIVVGLFAGALWLGGAFRVANASLVDLDLIWVRIPNLELWLLVVAAFVVGAAISAAIVGFAWLRGWVVIRRFKKATKKLEKELHELRSLPLSGSAGASLDADPAAALTANAKTGAETTAPTKQG